MRLSDLADLTFTYPDVGATAGTLPDGYHHAHDSCQIGSGRTRFNSAGDAVLRWGMQRGVGMRVEATTVTAATGTDMLGRLGPVQVPCRVVYVVDEPDRRGFAYGTLPGHPESGEELFTVRYDPASDAVFAEVTAFSRPALWWSRLGAPVARVAQRFIGRRYLRAV
ncbi:DUF1990 family protein [Mycolicibacterium sp. CBMA 226]|uniref:DUF1990 family protein n=1 Tax=Mycolicibacterium sp. CBMA 226 TaxID=2606611 RepID=UPI0012DED7C6|nr:DUF1990 domain-containing protein [Mycolicibacterium sp. CBMA 226]MUL80172.1 DUF1990 domain-containing protein [Mycolicibacterium sp. CBMA 226]